MRQPKINGQTSFWYEQTKSDARPALQSDTTADIVLVGAGYTSLWAAYYLKKARPDFDILVIEREQAGYGASGRNGGWLSSGLPGKPSKYAASHGVDSVVELQHAIFDSIDEIIRVAEIEKIDADIVKDGEIAVATNAAQMGRLRAEHEEASKWGFGADDLVLTDLSRTNDAAKVDGAVGGLFSPHGARVQPAKLAKGLANVVEALGVRIVENTRVDEIAAHCVTTSEGYTVEAQYVVRGTEGYTSSLPGQARTWLPKLSSMIVTRPLSDAEIAAVGWDSAVLVRTAEHSFSYIQRTADNRIALGGPGVPYLFGSAEDDNGFTPHNSVRALMRSFDSRFGVLSDVEIDHTWSGILGIPRDWSATVTVDHESGLCVAGGYVGDGVSSSNLAGRTLRDLILREDTRITRLPWVGRTIRKWEPEPLRWLALNGLYGVYSVADRLENRSSSERTSILARVANTISGRT